ncbi:MAG: preprotein translocase subunit YajC [Mycobacteriales bacterium]
MLLAAGNQSGGNGLIMIGFYVLIFGAAYFFMIRPQRARARAVLAAQAALGPGRQVVLTSGIYGTVLHVDEGKVGLEIAPGVHITVARAAVAHMVDEPADVALDDDPATPLD